MLTPTRATLSPSELKQVLEIQRSGRAFVLWRDGEHELQVLTLDERASLTIGRRSVNDIPLPHDREASRAHARLERIGDDWLLLDDGISRNGTFVNGTRVARRQRLVDGDQIRFGSTVVEFHRPRRDDSSVTAAPALTTENFVLTQTQRRILVALCRPYQDGDVQAPASNREIAREVFLGVDAVKAHLRELYRRFGIRLPPVQKRVALAQLALGMGIADVEG